MLIKNHPTGWTFKSHKLVRLFRKDEKEVEINTYKVSGLSETFIEKLTDLTQSCFPVCYRKGCRDDVAVHSEYLHVATKKTIGEIIGIVGETRYTSENPPNTYIAVAVVAESERGKGVYQDLIYNAIMQSLRLGINIITVDTQNAKVEYGIRKAFDRIIAEGRIENYNLTRKKIQEAYMVPGFIDLSYGYRPAGPANLDSSSHQLNKEFEVLDRDKGDKFEIRIEFTSKPN